MDVTSVIRLAGKLTYGGLALLALWGAFSIILLYRRIKVLSLPSPNEEERFIREIGDALRRGDYARATKACEVPNRRRRALPQLVVFAIANRAEGMTRLSQSLATKFQRTVLAGLEHRLSWIHTVARSSPMLGLLGTVLGMIGAFGKIAGAERTDPSALAEDISLALVTTAIGLVIAIPMILAASYSATRIRDLEGAVEEGAQHLINELAVSPPEAPAERAAPAAKEKK